MLFAVCVSNFRCALSRWLESAWRPDDWASRGLFLISGLQCIIEVCTRPDPCTHMRRIDRVEVAPRSVEFSSPVPSPVRTPGEIWMIREFSWLIGLPARLEERGTQKGFQIRVGKRSRIAVERIREVGMGGRRRETRDEKQTWKEHRCSYIRFPFTEICLAILTFCFYILVYTRVICAPRPDQAR